MSRRALESQDRGLGRWSRIAGLAAAVSFFEGAGGELQRHDDELVRHGLATLAAIPGLRLIGPTTAASRVPVFSFVLDGKGRVEEFVEKPQSGEGWINGGFFVLEPKVLDFIAGDETLWEREPMERLAEEGQLMAYRHEGFWQPMDTLREKRMLEDLWAKGGAPWKVWQG